MRNTIRIVIVDDHKMFLEGMRSVLNDQDGIEVIAAYNNAKSALSFLHTNQLDLLITDISMPEINGLEFVKRVKEVYPKLKILVVSMFDQMHNLKNIDGYILKESGYNVLSDAVRTIVLEDQPYFQKGLKKGSPSLEFNKNILSKREREIVILIAEELTTEAIADKLFLSKHTVETHKKNIFLKLDVHTAAGLIQKAMYLGYI